MRTTLFHNPIKDRIPISGEWELEPRGEWELEPGELLGRSNSGQDVGLVLIHKPCNSRQRIYKQGPQDFQTDWWGTMCNICNKKSPHSKTKELIKLFLLSKLGV